MSKEELLAILAKPQGDPERDHLEAERALLTYLGDKEIAEAWWAAADEQEWWYA